MQKGKQHEFNKKRVKQKKQKEEKWAFKAQTINSKRSKKILRKSNFV